MTRDFTPNSEGYLAAVWYAMKDAQERWALDEERIRQGRLGKWGYLRKIQQLFGADPVKVGYDVMRRDLQDFANTFGVPGALSTKDLEAMDEFDSIHRRDRLGAETTHRRNR